MDTIPYFCDPEPPSGGELNHMTDITLEKVRGKLDDLDTRLVDLIAERLALIPHVAECKKENGIARYQPEREKALIEDRRQRAQKKGINPDVMEDIMKRLITEAHRIEEDIIGE